MNGNGVQLGLLALGDDDLCAERSVQLGHGNGRPVLIVRCEVHVPRQPVNGKTLRVGEACEKNSEIMRRVFSGISAICYTVTNT